MLLFFIGVAYLFFIDFTIYKHRGHVQPDDPNSNDYPIITNPQDSFAHRIIDEAKNSKDICSK